MSDPTTENTTVYTVENIDERLLYCIVLYSTVYTVVNVDLSSRGRGYVDYISGNISTIYWTFIVLHISNLQKHQTPINIKIYLIDASSYLSLITNHSFRNDDNHNLQFRQLSSPLVVTGTRLVVSYTIIFIEFSTAPWLASI